MLRNYVIVDANVRVNSFSLISIRDGSCDCNVGGVGVIALSPHLPSLITEAATAERSVILQLTGYY